MAEAGAAFSHHGVLLPAEQSRARRSGRRFDRRRGGSCCGSPRRTERRSAREDHLAERHRGQRADPDFGPALNDTHALAALAKPLSIAVVSSAGDIEALTASQIARLSASGVTQLKATDQYVDLTAAQKQTLGAAKLAVVQPYGGGSAEVMRYQPSGLLASVSYRGIVGAAYTSYTITYGTDGRPISACSSNGMTRISASCGSISWSRAGWCCFASSVQQVIDKLEQAQVRAKAMTASAAGS